MAKTVLVVEDDKALNDAYRLILEQEKYTVLSVFNGHEALEVLGSKKVDIILLDISMPKMDGIEFLEHFDNPTDIKICVFSNRDSESDINRVYELGAHRYILKAWASPRELVKLVKDTLAA